MLVRKASFPPPMYTLQHMFVGRNASATAKGANLNYDANFKPMQGGRMRYKGLVLIVSYVHTRKDIKLNHHQQVNTPARNAMNNRKKGGKNGNGWSLPKHLDWTAP